MGSWSMQRTEGEAIIYKCPRCPERTWLLAETLETLRVCLSDPTIGYPELDLLCPKCQHVGSARADLVSRRLQGMAFEALSRRQVGQWPMRCAMEGCEVRRPVVVLGNANTASEELRLQLVDASIPEDFLCAKGHQIRKLV